MKIKPMTLEGEFVRLAPLKLSHLAELFEAANDETLWLWTNNNVKTREDMLRYIETALGEFERKVSLPFVTIEKSSGVIIGSTRFGNIEPAHRKAEIGWTWINPQWQRTAINTEAKLLMLTHAFETWKCVRVELKTDVLNEKSRNAIRQDSAALGNHRFKWFSCSVCVLEIHYLKGRAIDVFKADDWYAPGSGAIAPECQ